VVSNSECVAEIEEALKIPSEDDILLKAKLSYKEL
jgi:hypothetical protein